jgi:alanyl-tRNA synthetase
MMMSGGSAYIDWDRVKFLYVENANSCNLSKEVCSGPHVSNTSEIGRFKILKEQSSSAGMRRIRAVIR